MDENQKMSYGVEVFNLSEHLPLDVEPVIGRKWVLNGEDNNLYNLISDAYDDSATNSAIINGYVQYIYGEGLYDASGVVDIKKHLSKSDTRLLVNDYKTYGAYAVQIIWNSAKKLEDKKPLKIEWVSIKRLGLNVNKETMDIDGYWESWDWSQKHKYKPCFYPKFTGSYKGEDIEMLIVNRPSPKPFFPQPDYISAIRYCQLEGELSNYAYKTTQNGFQASMIINVNNGQPETQELGEQYKRQIITHLTKTDNAGKVIVSFNKDASTAMTIEEVPAPSRNELYAYFDEIAERKIKVAHNAPPILFAGSQEGSGFSNNADEILVATKSLYRKMIYPARETILEDGLQKIFDLIDIRINLEFKDYEEFTSDDYKNKERQ